MLELNNLLLKQFEMMKQIKIFQRDNQESDNKFTISFMKWHGSSKFPKILSTTKNYITLNYEDYLNNCKVNTAQNLKSLFNLDLFINVMENISSNEILLYRHRLEETLQTGLHALIQIQFLDSLLILREKECVEKLKFNPESLENMKLLIDNLVKFHSLNPSTVANELYENEKVRLLNSLKVDFSYTSLEIDEAQLSIKLQALAIALTQQHECEIARDSNTLGNLFALLLPFIKNLDVECRSKYSENHRVTWN